VDLRHVVTNHHVVDDCHSIRLRINGATQAGSIISVDARNDLALLRLPQPLSGPLFSPASFTTARVRLGQGTVVIGFPLGDILASSPNLTTGVVSALAGPKDDVRLIQITAPIQPGNSGGPLIAENGSVLGMVVASLDSSIVSELGGAWPQNVNFAIRGSVIQAFLDANGVTYLTSEPSSQVTTTMLADNARRFVASVECFK
jgi:S1-C subfamily serine protease